MRKEPFGKFQKETSKGFTRCLTIITITTIVFFMMMQSCFLCILASNLQGFFFGSSRNNGKHLRETIWIRNLPFTFLIQYQIMSKGNSEFGCRTSRRLTLETSETVFSGESLSLKSSNRITGLLLKYGNLSIGVPSLCFSSTIMLVMLMMRRMMMVLVIVERVLLLLLVVSFNDTNLWIEGNSST
jgi:hypothetical protein